MDNFIWHGVHKKRPEVVRKSAEDMASEAEKQEREEACDRVLEAFRRAYDMRSTFIMNLSERDARAFLVDALDMAYEGMVGMVMEQDILDKFCELNNTAFDEDADEYPSFSQILDSTKAGPAKIQLYWLYACAQDGPMACVQSSRYMPGYGEYKADEKLSEIYRVLSNMGYQMSDEEAALMDGTSQLYYREAQKQTEPDPETEPELEEEETRDG